DGDACVALIRRAGHPKPTHVADGSLYPPPTLAVLSPLGVMDWQTARLVWLAINLFACIALVWALANWLSIKDVWVRWLTASLLVMAWGPVSTSLSLGQLSLVAGASGLVGMVLLDRGKALPAGLLIGLGCLIKPQLGLGFVLLVALRMDWRALSGALGLIVVGLGVAIGRLMSGVPDWAGQLSSNIMRYSAEDGVMDASVDAVMRYQMIDLRPLMHLVVPERFVGLASLAVVGFLAALALRWLLPMGLRRHTLLAVSGVGLLTLMPVYHRYYDAVLLLPLLVLVVNAICNRPIDRLVWVLAIPLLPLFFPLPAMFATIGNRGVLPGGLADAWLWQNGVMLHQAWCLLVLLLALVWWTARRARAKAGTDK
ncbi:MAG: glycosyltransferase family 87 protein, partial [Phycisphaeraceae bacterium]